MTANTRPVAPDTPRRVVRPSRKAIAAVLQGLQDLGLTVERVRVSGSTIELFPSASGAPQSGSADMGEHRETHGDAGMDERRGTEPRPHTPPRHSARALKEW